MVIDRSSAGVFQYVVPQAKKLHFHLPYIDERKTGEKFVLIVKRN